MIDPDAMYICTMYPFFNSEEWIIYTFALYTYVHIYHFSIFCTSNTPTFVRLVPKETKRYDPSPFPISNLGWVDRTTCPSHLMCQSHEKKTPPLIDPSTTPRAGNASGTSRTPPSSRVYVKQHAAHYVHMWNLVLPYLTLPYPYPAYLPRKKERELIEAEVRITGREP